MTYTLPKLVNKSNVLGCLNAICHARTNSAQLEVDASQVEQCDTSALALLLELEGLSNCKLINKSQALRQLAELYQIPCGNAQ